MTDTTAKSARQPVTRPARGTRPANRRQLILDAARTCSPARDTPGSPWAMWPTPSRSVRRCCIGIFTASRTCSPPSSRKRSIPSVMHSPEPRTNPRPTLRPRWPRSSSSIAAQACCGSARHDSSPPPTARNSAPPVSRSPHGSPHSSAHDDLASVRPKRTCWPGQAWRWPPASRCTAWNCPNPNSPRCWPN